MEKERRKGTHLKQTKGYKQGKEKGGYEGWRRKADKGMKEEGKQMK